jgi:uncharacterized YigZ family protein
MIDSYITVSGNAREEIVINKSRFIGYASPCVDEQKALAMLQRVREEHKSATHHCYAYIIGENSGIMRYSDDGEPGGTAGMPIMDVMRNRSVVNCCIVVVRYFGGVLLGTGGLVRAYTRSAQAALEEAGVARMELTSSAFAEVPYPVWDKFRYAAERLPVRIENVEYGSSVGFRLCYRSSDENDVLPRLMDAAERKLELLPEGESFSPWEIKT